MIDTSVSKPITGNEIESVAEWLVEEWMDIDTAIPDTDGEQDDKQHVKKATDWSSPEPALTLPLFQYSLSSFPLAKMPFYVNLAFDIYTLPPEVIS